MAAVATKTFSPRQFVSGSMRWMHKKFGPTRALRQQTADKSRAPPLFWETGARLLVDKEQERNKK